MTASNKVKYNWPEDKRAITQVNIQQTQNVLLRMMKIFDQICEHHKIDYWLEYGTMLGAIRHKGFIPWDHEADVGMFRSDYNQFVALAAADLPEDIFFQSRATDPYYITPSSIIEAKLRDKYSNYHAYAQKNPELRWHNGIQLDIFVYDVEVDNGGEVIVTNAFERLLTNRKSYYTETEIEHLELCEFEDTVFPVPAGYDAYLQRNYGNYMELPPPEARIPEVADVFHHCQHTAVLKWPY